MLPHCGRQRNNLVSIGPALDSTFPTCLSLGGDKMMENISNFFESNLIKWW